MEENKSRVLIAPFKDNNVCQWDVSFEPFIVYFLSLKIHHKNLSMLMFYFYCLFKAEYYLHVYAVI